MYRQCLKRAHAPAVCSRSHCRRKLVLSNCLGFLDCCGARGNFSPRTIRPGPIQSLLIARLNPVRASGAGCWWPRRLRRPARSLPGIAPCAARIPSAASLPFAAPPRLPVPWQEEFRLSFELPPGPVPDLRPGQPPAAAGHFGNSSRSSARPPRAGRSDACCTDASGRANRRQHKAASAAAQLTFEGTWARSRSTESILLVRFAFPALWPSVSVQDSVPAWVLASAKRSAALTEK